MLAVGLSQLGGCIYPHRGTALSPVRGETRPTGAPAELYRLTILEAQIPPRRAGDLTWDEDGGGPDALVRVFRNEELIWESDVVEDDLNPSWQATLPRNVMLPTSAGLRFEVWDRDVVGSDPIGIYRHQGLPPTALMDAEARLMMPGGAYLSIRVSRAMAHRGLGLSEYEVQPEALLVVELHEHSPASRAGMVVGDRIVAIGGITVADLGSAAAASALSMSVRRHQSLTVLGSNGRERELNLDRGFVWLSM